MTFDITVPVLNEEPTIDTQIRKIHAFLEQNWPNQANLRWKIVIADNGSTDKTPEIAEKLSRELTGVGLALKTSWAQSTADIVGYMDLDLATDLAHFPDAIFAIESDGFDVVNGSRLLPKSKVIGRTFTREISSRVFNFILKNYLGVRFSDGMCGFKWLRREHVAMLRAGGAVSNGWFFSTEFLAIAEWNSLKIKELAVKWTDDTTGSKVNIPRLARQYLAAMRVLKSKKVSQNVFADNMN
jgi:glycosyltransferase involved in cell wall biosynthesis